MAFSSYAFLFLFLPPTLAGFYLLRRPHRQLVFLLIASIVFYCQWSAPYSLLMLFTVCFDFYVAGAITATDDARRKKRLLWLSLGTNLTILGFFKYYGFFAETTNAIAGAAWLPTIRVLLPIGISFYTFQSMSYVIDVYRGNAHAHRRLLPFAGYVTMFPHQISGPLVRHDLIVPQLESERTYLVDTASLWRGTFFFILGLSKKILIADRLAAVVSPIVGNMTFASRGEAAVAMLGYTMQLYFDFSGYSDMAVGLGHLLNIRFPQNFNSPYRATSLTDFWRRWHITLSSWLRDYLYISLGGNRRGELRTHVNLLLTMLLGGLWHGANWTFAVWGLLHGAALSVERVFRGRGPTGLVATGLRWAFTFLFVNVAWVFFRSPNFSTAFLWLRKVFIGGAGRGWNLASVAAGSRDRFFVALVLSCAIAWFGRNTFQMRMKPTIGNALWLGLLFGACLMYLHEESPFLYFQF